MTPKRIIDALGPLMRTGRPVMIWGPPGVGKSAAVRAAADAEGREVLDVRVVLLDPVDLRGIPTVRDGVTHWAPPAFLPRDPESRCVLFLDELPQACAAVQAACLSLLLDRTLGEYTLPPGVAIVSAGNRAEDRAGANRLISPALNRLIHLDCEPCAEDWHAWAVGSCVHPAIRSFLQYRPSLLCQPVPTDGSRAWPTPRSWECVSDVMRATGEATQDIISGIVGPGAAAELLAFVALAERMPQPQAVLADPSHAPIPGEPSILYALVGALVEHLRACRDRVDQYCAYVARFPAEFALLAMRDGLVVCPDMLRCPAAARWIGAHKEAILAARA